MRVIEAARLMVRDALRVNLRVPRARARAVMLALVSRALLVTPFHAAVQLSCGQGHHAPQAGPTPACPRRDSIRGLRKRP